jgi:glycosyltransferase involved in cell wall biosynthesis
LIAHGLPADRIRVVGRGVCPRRFSPRFRDENLRATWGYQYPHKLLYVGRASREKNLDCLMEAFKLLMRVRRDTCLVVTGEGPYLNTLASQLAGLPVVFTGLLQDGELARVYASSDLFVFPSETDTLGLVVLEAQASGLPVIASGRGGPRHVMEHGVTGLVLEEMSPLALSAAIHCLLDDPDRRAAMSRAARRHALQHRTSASFDAFWALHGGPGSAGSPSPPEPAFAYAGEF